MPLTNVQLWRTAYMTETVQPHDMIKFHCTLYFALISQIYFGMKLYMFRTVRLSIIRSLFTVHSAMAYVIQPVWHIPLLSVQWINSWWWTDELSETCRVSCQNKFVKLVHKVGFIIKRTVVIHDTLLICTSCVLIHSIPPPSHPLLGIQALRNNQTKQ